MKLIIDIDDETYQNVRFYGECLLPRDKANLEQALKNAKLVDEWTRCPQCGGMLIFNGIKPGRYCPHCGTDIRGKDDEID